MNPIAVRTNFWRLFVVNFLGVFNDNFIKALVIFIGVKWVAPEHQAIIQYLAMALLVIPFLLLSALAGKLAHNHYKQKILEKAKLAEIFIALVATVGLLLQNVYVLMLAILLMGVQSAILAPSKYGLVRDIGGVEKVNWGVGLMEMFTFLGVLVGTYAGTVIADYADSNLLSIALMFLFAIVGWITAKLLKATESLPEKAKENSNPVGFVRQSHRFAKKNYWGLNNVIFGLALFWFYGTVIIMNMRDYSIKSFGFNPETDNHKIGYILNISSVGIALGCLLSGNIAKRFPRFNIVIGGSFIFSLVILLVYFLQPDIYVFTTLIFLASAFSGFYKIPLNAFIQETVKGRNLNDMLAYDNLSEFVFISLAAGVLIISSIIFPDWYTEFNFLFLGVFSFLMTCYLFLFFRKKGI